MTLEQLRIFVAVANLEHVTRAAEALGIVQSAASAAIAALESAYNVLLFHRIGRRIELTDAGREFLTEARAVLGRVEAAELTLSELGELKRGTLSIYASQTIGTYWLPPRLARYRFAHPKISIRLSIANTAQVIAAVNSGTAELGFVEREVDDPALSVSSMEGDQLAVVTVAGDTPGSQTELTPENIYAMDWILREPGSGTRAEFEAELRRRGIEPARLNVVLELPSNEAVLSAVIAGAGVTAISEFVVASRIRYGSLKKLNFAMQSRLFHILRHKERYRSRAADALFDLLPVQKNPS